MFGCAGWLPLGMRSAAARRPRPTWWRKKGWGRRCGVLSGAVMPGSRVAIVGAGPIGLAALQTASLLSPAAVFVLDVSDARLQACPPPRAPAAAPCSAVCSAGRNAGSLLPLLGDCQRDGKCVHGRGRQLLRRRSARRNAPYAAGLLQ